MYWLLFIWLELLQIVPICAQNYTDNPITLTREFVILNGSSDPFFSAIWSDSNIYAWSSGPSQSGSVYVISMEGLEIDLEANVTEATVTGPTVVVPAGPFADATDISIYTGVYDSVNDELYFFGYSKLYRIDKLVTPLDLQSAEKDFEFPALVLPSVSFIRDGVVYGLQTSSESTVDEILPPKLYAVNMTLYSTNYNANSTKYYNFTSTLSQTFEIDETNGYITTGSRLGLLEIRTYPQFDYVSLISFPNITGEGEPLNIKHVTIDKQRGLLYFCGDLDDQIRIVRVNISDGGRALDGQIFFPDTMTDLSSVYALSSQHAGLVCTGIVIDPIIGVGYISAADSTQVGYLAKFDIKNMVFLGRLLMPIGRDATKIFDMHIDPSKRIMYTLLGDSIATYQNYPTSCSNDCTPPNGNCLYSECKCTTQWIGNDCSEAACTLGCNEENNGGVCSNGNCYCKADWTGTTCEDRRCPFDCLGQGVCGGLETNYTCKCDDFATGRDCGTQKFTSCESINSDPDGKRFCLRYGPTCGFCEDDQQCKTGGRQGPEFGACRVWLYDGNLDTFPIIVAAIIIFCWVVMFLINSISAIIEDWRIARSLEKDGHEGSAKDQKRAWWRDERSAISWKLWDQIQFLALYTIINMPFSSRLMNFSSLFNWTAFCIPFPAFADNTYHPSRTLNSIDQYSNSVGVTADKIFWVCIIWWLITIGVTTVLYGGYYLFCIFVLKKGDTYATLFVNRFFHLLCRLALAGYLPICCLAGWAIIDPTHRDGLLIIPILFLIVIGFGLPVLNFLVVKGEKTDFLFYSTRIRFGSLYVQFKQDKAKFAFLVYARKLILAIFFGFLIPQTQDLSDVNLFYAQVIIPAVIMLLYIVSLVVVKPYVDVVHTFLDGFLNLLNILTLGVAILFLNSDVSQRESGLFAVLVFQLTGLISVILAYLHTWMYYAGYNSLSELCGKKKPEEKELVPSTKSTAADTKEPDSGSSKSSKHESSKSEEEMKEKPSKKQSESSKSEEKPKPKPKKKKKKAAAKTDDDHGTPKEINEENLGNLSISDD